MFTLPMSVSYRDLTRRTPLINWLLRHSSSSYITLNRTSVTVAWKGCLRSVSEQQARWGLCYVTRINAKVTWYSPTPGACDVTAACCVGTVFQYCCVTSSRLRGNLVYRLVLGNGLRNPTMGWHVTVWCLSTVAAKSENLLRLTSSTDSRTFRSMEYVFLSALCA
jgi:hypothetical protein